MAKGGINSLISLDLIKWFYIISDKYVFHMIGVIEEIIPRPCTWFGGEFFAGLYVTH